MMVTDAGTAPARGLTEEQARERLREYGPNQLVPPRESASLAAWIIRLIADPMVVLLAIAGGTYAVLGDRFDAIVVALALLPIFLVTAVLEFRSDRALERLNAMAPPRASVIRDGIEQRIDARETVPGDTLLVREGDVIAADARIFENTRLLLDESALTGESLPVEKDARGDAALFAGTVVRSGRALAEVQATGAQTEYGRIARAMSKIAPQRTPIERVIHRVVLQVGIAVVIVCALVVLIGRLHGDAWPIAIIAGVSLAMAAIPEEMPMVYTLYLALGAWRLAKDEALVRRLSSVETLGATTVICVDKTGTLTYGRLAVDEIYAVPGRSRDDVLSTAELASDPHSGDPVDAAILQTLSHGSLRGGKPLIVLPFDPAHRFSAAIWDGAPEHRLAVKGAYEALCERGAIQDGQGAHAFIERATQRGARVLAVGETHVATQSVTAETAQTAPLDLVGLIAFADPVREDARDAVARCRAAGIRFMMITGDHPATAAAIARAVGIDFEDVRARVRPEEKLRIVRELHAQGEIVAMTGDGTNDALALREADIGVAMGKGGTEVARAAADLVLLDDDVTTIVRAVADGRRIFANLRHAFSYLNAFHAPLLLSALILPLAGAPILLYPIHLIWLELIVHPTSALVFENDPAREDLMTTPPRNPKAALVGAQDWRRALLLGFSLAAAVLAAYLYLLHTGSSESLARTAAIITMITGQSLLVYVERAGSRPLWSVTLRGNRAVVPVVAGTLGSVALVVLVAPLAAALHLSMLPWTMALYAAALGALAVTWTQPYYAWSARKAARSCVG